MYVAYFKIKGDPTQLHQDFRKSDVSCIPLPSPGQIASSSCMAEDVNGSIKV